jgi:hypothetical protein
VGVGLGHDIAEYETFEAAPAREVVGSVSPEGIPHAAAVALAITIKINRRMTPSLLDAGPEARRLVRYPTVETVARCNAFVHLEPSPHAPPSSRWVP